MSKICVFALALGLTLTSWSQQAAPPGDSPLDMTQRYDTKVMPLHLAETKHLHGLKLYARSHQDLTVTLRNVSTEPTDIQRIIPTCPCLSVLEAKLPAKLAPQGEFTFRCRIDGRRIAPGEFTKKFYVKLSEEQRFGSFSFTGEVKNMVEITPAIVIDLGDSSGLTPWTRTFNVKTLFPEDLQLKLKPLEKAPFTAQLEKLSAQEYRLTVSPNLPLPPKRYLQKFELETEAIKEYGPVTTQVRVKVNEIVKLDIDKSRHVLKKSAEPMTLAFRLVPERRRLNKMKNRFHDDHDHPENAYVIEDPLQDKEERDLWSPNELKTWEALAALVKGVKFPEGITLEAKASKVGCIDVTLTIQPQAVAEKDRLQLELQVNSRRLGKLYLFFK